MTENKWDIFMKTGRIGDYLSYKDEDFLGASEGQNSVNNDSGSRSSGEIVGGERQIH